MIVTKQNFEEVAHTICAGVYSAQKYNKECFGMSDLWFAHTMTECLEDLLDHIENAGYDIVHLASRIWNQHGYFLKVEPNHKLKQQLDDEFEISGLLIEKYYHYCKNITADNIEYFNKNTIKQGDVIRTSFHIDDIEESPYYLKVEDVEYIKSGAYIKGMIVDGPHKPKEIIISPYSRFLLN
ncbi:hypothetical protein J2S74_002950 [Evansella vedderi]|uniref:Uncharacterized protein n=1 Tax=Evansella vedderi TaxID=38282 RepID=A0ABT9ZWH6_9BACI|nr:hypothetical protein [Evansella vedderi]MDQ0255568.1 hypothetical protein [Evansella vedderi]